MALKPTAQSCLFGGLLVLSAPVLAGFYGGGLIGGNLVNVGKDLTYPFELPNPTYSSFNSAYGNFHGQLFAGYKLNLPTRAGLSLQIDGDLFAGNTSWNIENWFFNNNVAVSEKLRYGTGVFALYEQGISPDITLFAGPGYVYDEFSTSFDQSGGNIGISANESKWLSGVGLKAGVAGRLSNAVELMFTWQFNQYQSASWTGIEPITGSILQANYRPSANLILVGLRFCAEPAPQYSGK